VNTVPTVPEAAETAFVTATSGIAICKTYRAIVQQATQAARVVKGPPLITVTVPFSEE
jgi:hypothetical protein